MEVVPYDLELFLPLELIRIECGLEGDNRYTDGVLADYRNMVLDMAHQHTGLPIRERVLVEEQLVPVEVRQTGRQFATDGWGATGLGTTAKPTTQHRTAIMIATDTVTVKQGGKSRSVTVTPGSRIVPLAEATESVNILQVYRPRTDDGPGLVQYVAGFPSEQAIPEAIHEGAIELLRHMFTHRAAGYDPKTKEVVGVVVASGAQDTWAALSS